MPLEAINGVTLQVGVGDMPTARAFYDRLFGKEPDFVAAEDFHEYEIYPGVWFQITSAVAPGLVRRVRFGVPDVAAARDRLMAESFDIGVIITVPGVVSYCNVADPFGNPLGLYEDLAG
jgi:catechol 2,3-dioxygenase-like lactoylglutathione lyase family enzyme